MGNCFVGDFIKYIYFIFKRFNSNFNILLYLRFLFVIISLDRLSETGVNLNWIFIIIIGSL